MRMCVHIPTHKNIFKVCVVVTRVYLRFVQQFDAGICQAQLNFRLQNQLKVELCIVTLEP